MCVAILALIALGMVAGVAHAAIGMPPEAAPLIRHFYKVHNTCANVEPFVRHQVQLVYDNDRTVAPKLIKLLYADCMIN
ncbi:probable peroxidase 26, partial [Tanacetum coccineum]